MHILNPSTQGKRQEDLFEFKTSQPGLQNKFLNNQGYPEKACHKEEKKGKRWET